MNKDFRVSVTMMDHPKTAKLTRRLGDKSLYCLLKLWAFTATNRPEGTLSGMTEEDVEIAANWTGEPGVFVSTLVELGWLDDNENIFSIHDWKDHNGYAAHANDRKKQAVKASNARWKNRTAPKNNGKGKGKKVVTAHAGSNAQSMNQQCSEHESAMLRTAGSNAPSPSPIPVPSPVPSPDPAFAQEPPNPPGAGGQRAREKKPKSSSNGKNYSDDFLRFWEVYPKKSAKRDAWKAWGQMKKELPDMDTLLRAVAFAAESVQWTRDQGQFIPFPATWLRRAGWEDETLPGTSQRRIEVLDIPSGESNPYNHKPGDPVGLHFDKLREIVAAGRLANGEGGE